MRTFILALLICFSTQVAAQSVRIKDLVSFDGVRSNDLVGYGLVVGLNGTGDGLRNSPFTEDLMSNILERLGVNVAGESFRPKNVAAVIVTAKLHSFARRGSSLDVTVSTIGDATSLLGGTLVMTPLNAADGQVYAVAQGSIISGGVSVQGDAASTVKGVPTAGTIPSGASVEREVPFELNSLSTLRLALRNPDFTTARRIEQAINSNFGRSLARMLDPGTIEFDISKTRTPSTAHAIETIENLLIVPEAKARVVVDQRSGTIVIGANVKISNVAIAQGDLTLTVQEAPVVVQPSPFSDGETVVVPRTTAEINEEERPGLIALPSSTTLADLVTGLNALGVSTQQMISLLKSIKSIGALHAELIIE